LGITPVNFALATVVLFSQVGPADEIRGTLPTLLEEHANRPTTNLVFFQETSRLSSGQTLITVAAIVIEVADQQRKRMQGVQIDLAGNSGTDRVYLDADGISDVLKDIRKLQREIEMSAMEKEAGHEFGIHGTAECAPSTLVVLHSVCPEYFRFRDSSGVALRPAGMETWFPLPGIDLQELADAIRSAIPVLESAGQ
jgi:hypothetical protein